MDGSTPRGTTPLLPPAGHGAAVPSREHVVRCRAGGHLRAILDPGITLAIWERPLPPGIAGGLDRRPVADWPALRIETTADGVRADLAATMPAPLPRPLSADIVRLVRLYAGMVATRTVHLRLDTVTGNGCRYFHADSVGIRLLCTYRGRGTQWLPDGAVNRDALGSGDNAAVAPDPHRIRSLAAGQVALLKGEAWPGNRGNGIVHRSPPADPKAGPRLLLCLEHEAD